MKLYADEPGRDAVRKLDLLVISCLARVEVPAAIWRKQRLRQLTEEDATLLTHEFEADYFGTETDAPRFVITAIVPVILDAAARLVATRKLRADDGIQLASACAVRDADPACDAFACADAALREAARAEGFALVP